MRISEIYESVQGEGPRVGEPTIFVRFAGCNLRCPGWPCDTQHAIDPKVYRKEWLTMCTQDVLKHIYRMPHYSTIRNICLTGGEPFLQAHNELATVYEELSDEGKSVECFSNGTILYPTWAIDGLRFVMDWKLPGSGEVPIGGLSTSSQYLTEGEKLNVVYKNSKELSLYPNIHAIKFTVASRDDFNYAVTIWQNLLHETRPQLIYVAPVWSSVTPKALVSWMLKAGVPWRLNLQMHNFIWSREQRGI
jgi:7-carboxy-7-deazaguanine synthase